MLKHKKYLFLLILLTAVIAIPISRVSAAATITVDSSADNTTGGNGLCTLREAMLNANADSDTTSGDCVAGSGTDTIEFDITSNEGAGPHTISPSSDLPDINSIMIIDGYSETGATANAAVAPAPFDGTIMIQIDGAGTIDRGFWLGNASGGSTIKGLSITGFAIDGILLEPADGNTIAGNYIGVQPDGTTQDANYTGIYINNSDNHTIGGTTAASRNVISGNTANGITQDANLTTSTGILIQGNYIGLASDGVTDLGNGNNGISMGHSTNTIGGTTTSARNVISGNGGDGIRLDNVSSITVAGNFIGTDYTGNVDVGNSLSGVSIHGDGGNTIGGTTSSSRNVISGNDDHGIFFASSANENVVSGNYIGMGADGTTDVGNTDPAVSINSGSSDNIIGGDTAGEANLIRRNDDSGVAISGPSSLNNAIIGNSLYQNLIPNIDLGDDGVILNNDANDADSGANDLLNYPEWTTVTETGGDTDVDYSLDVPAGDYRVETFSDNGKTLVDTQNITHTGSGSENFANTITGNNYPSLRMTATEIDGGLSSGFGATSEYSDAYSSGSATITVNSTADDQSDDGECTLREAITSANDNLESGATDGECIAGAATDTIEFDIAGVGPHTIQPSSALPTITASNTTINGYSETGAVENSGDYSACFVGTIMIEIDGTNTTSVDGLTINGNDVTVRGLAINRFDNDGIQISTVDGAVVAGNILGLDTDGLVDQGNGDAGVAINSTGDTMIGGTTAADRNLISGNDGYGGISINSDAGTTTASGNCIGTDATGDVAVPNNHYGINLYQVEANVVIGGDTTHERNIISGNDEHGISLDESNVGSITGNYIGTNVDGSSDLGNGYDGIVVDNDSNVSYIGGLTSGEHNVISGNDQGGINLATGTGDTRIRGNYIGVDATGTTDLGNTTDGIYAGTTNIIIGGTTSGARNVVSGNDQDGIELNSSATGASIQGNYVGLNSAGTAGIGNTNVGIGTGGADAVIGGTASGAENVVSDNGAGGISADGDDSIIQGNLVGTSSDGLTVIGNTSVGIKSGGSNLIIGGDLATERNVVAGTIFGGNYVGSGIVLLSFGSGESGGVVQGNYVGTNINGAVGGGFGNAGFGVFVIGDYSNGFVGGTGPGEGNKIASSGISGVAVNSFTTFGLYATDNTIIGNQIYQNGSTGIRLMDDTDGNFVADTPTPYPNDTGFDDADEGSNDFINFPVINSTSASVGSLDINFDLDVRNTNVGVTGYRIEFFANDTGDASGNGEGQIYLGSAVVSGDVTGHTETITLDPGVIATGTYDVTATTTEIDGSADGFASTSEFSAFKDDQEIIQPLDNDGDGVNDSVENAGPNSGDGNDDGTLDSEQANVATILDAESDDYVTLAVDPDGECDQIDDFASKLESELSESDPDFIYPLTLVEFTIPCADSVDGTIYWHGEEEFTSQIYRKFGPTTPGDTSTTGWYTSEQFITSTEDIGGEATATASFTLVDGEVGDDTGDDDVIVDANGPGIEVETTDSVVDSISSAVSDVLSNTGMNQYGFYVLAGVLIVGGSVFIVKRKFYSKASK